jgi:malonate transporter and related proteins
MNLELVISAFEITFPILIILLLGGWFKQKEWIDTGFVSSGNTLVFNISLPCLLFLNVSQNSISENLNLPLISFAVIATLISVVVVWLLYFRKSDSGQRGVLAQCAYRGNMAIIGLALCERALGQGILGKAAIYLAFLTILYNLIAVVLLTTFNRNILLTMTKNPLIISIVLGLLSSASSTYLPQAIITAMEYLAKLTLPLALLCLGASLQWQSFKQNHREAIVITLVKLVIVPLLTMWAASQFEFDKTDMALLFFMVSAPTAVAAYVMANKMTKHGTLAAEIVALSTLVSPITIAIGYYLLKVKGLA